MAYDGVLKMSSQQLGHQSRYLDSPVERGVADVNGYLKIGRVARINFGWPQVFYDCCNMSLRRADYDDSNLELPKKV